MVPEKKVLYLASTAGHLATFHIPYLKKLKADGWTVFGAGAGSSRELDFLDKWLDMPFKKRISSPKNFALAFKLAKVMKEQRFSLVLVHTSLAAFFARLAVILAGKGETRVVNTVHGYLFDDHTGLMKRTLLLWAEKLTAKVTDRIIVMNKQDLEIANKYKLSGGDVVFVPGMGVDMSALRPASAEGRRAARESLGLADDAFVMVFAGEFSGRKNQSMLISAMRLLPDNTVLLLPGRGDTLESCRSRVRELGLEKRVIMPGYVTDIGRYYLASDICVSSSRSEGLPFNLMEAMACGLPAVVTEVKGHVDLVSHGENGYLFPYGDEQGFADMVTAVMDGDIDAMGGKARASVRRYELKNVLPVTYRAYFADHISD